MAFPKLRLGKKTRELREKELKENQEVLNKYDTKTENLDNLKTNHVYKGPLHIIKKYTYNDHVIVKYNNRYYCVMRLFSKGKFLPFVFDVQNLGMIKAFKAGNKEGYWRMTNRFVCFSKKDNGKLHYLHNFLTKNYQGGMNRKGKDKQVIEHLNGNTLDNRMVNLVKKPDEKNNRNSNKHMIRCGNLQLFKMSEPYKTFYKENQSSYIYWLPSRYKGHQVFVSHCGPIKKRRFRSSDEKQVPKLMLKAEKHLIKEAKNYGITEEQLLTDIDPLSYRLQREYDQIVLIASKFFKLDKE